jgi:hypothetical protein
VCKLIRATKISQRCLRGGRSDRLEPIQQRLPDGQPAHKPFQRCNHPGPPPRQPHHPLDRPAITPLTRDIQGHTDVRWKGLRCNLEVSGATAGVKADLRRDTGNGPSVATTAKAIDDGAARLLVEDDELEGAVAIAVLISRDGRVSAQI